MKRVLRMGPGLVLALVALVLLWPRLREGTQADRPRIERGRLGAIPTPPAAPEIGWLLEQGDKLDLEPAQVMKLRRIKTRWDRETGALRDALDRASAQFGRKMSSPGSRNSIEDVRERAAPVSELSRQLAAARHGFWSEAAQLLTSAQRRQAEEAWTRRLGGRQTSPPR